MTRMLLIALAFIGASFTSRVCAQNTIPFEFTSEEDNRLIKENDSFKYYVASGDTNNIVCLDEDGSYYKLLSKDHKLIAEGAFTVDADKYIQQGKWTEHYSNGKVKLTGYYIQGKPAGTWQEYYNTGKLKTVFNFAIIDDDVYRSSCLSGSYQEFYQNGKIKMVGFYAATSSTTKDTIGVDDPVTGERMRTVATHKTYKAEKTGNWEHYDENGELEKKE